MELRGQIENTFGAALFERPLFYSYHGALRFELSEGKTSVAQFLNALRKALTIASDVFSGASTFILCLRTRVPGRSWGCRNLLRELREVGITIPSERALWAEALDADDWVEEGDPKSAVTLAFQVPIELLQNTLWGALAGELGISPRLQCSVYLLNLQTGVAMYPYDDRGMDVVGPNRAALGKLYVKHRSLLLPYDLPQMQNTFGVL